jgi:hemoglobin-like flavoprotein
MDMQLIGRTWDHVGSGRHEQVIKSFYDRLFELYPEYRDLFPQSLDHHMKKMVDTLALLARVADETEIVHPQMMRLGAKHTSFHLKDEDLKRFQIVFVKVLSECCGEHWTDDCEKAWNGVFEQHIIPYMHHGLVKH